MRRAEIEARRATGDSWARRPGGGGPWSSVRAGALRLVRGGESDAVWVRPALLGLLAATLALYTWSLGDSGWANSYYAAAVQAATESWKAFFFGSFDASNYITVDKTPASLWAMALSARIFGLNTWSLLAPQALMGVGTVWLTYAAVRRWSGPAAGLVAGGVVALTPVAALMFRYDNPDALLTLLLVGSGYATLRAVEDGRTRWLVLAGTLVGFGYLTKMLQAFIVLPVFALVYVVTGPPRLWKRVWQSAAAGLSVVASAGWWVAAVELWPASSRPFIGGSTTNSILQLTFGYNGFGRITGNEVGAVGARGPVGPGGFGGATGIARLFENQMAGQIAWLLPAALVALVVGLWVTRRAGRTDTLRAGFLLWGGWLLLTGGIFSFAGGIIHEYYTVVLAPAIGALVGMAAPPLWRRRDRVAWRSVAGLMVAGTAAWSFVLLGQTPEWLPWLRWTVLAAGVAGAAAFVAGGGIGAGPADAGASPGADADRRAVPWPAAMFLGAVAVVTVVGMTGGSAAYTLSTAGNTFSGGIPTAGPAVAGRGPGGFRGPGPGQMGAQPGQMGARPGQGGIRPGQDGQRLPPPPASGSSSVGAGAQGGVSGGGGDGTGGAQGGAGVPAPDGPGAFGVPGGASGTATPTFRGPGLPGMGGQVEVSEELAALLREAAADHRWAAAMTAASTAAPFQLASGAPIMAIGGFNGTDRSMTLAEFQARVSAGEVGYYIVGGGFAGSPNTGLAGEVAAWVQQSFRSTTVGGVTVYDLSRPVPIVQTTTAVAARVVTA